MSEKRQHERVLVEGVWLELASGRFCVVDISEKAFRVLGLGEDMVVGAELQGTLCFGNDGEALRERFFARVIRRDSAFCVFALEAPRAGWMDFVKGFSALKTDQLNLTLFD